MRRGQMGQVGFHAHADLFMEARPLNRCHLPQVFSTSYDIGTVVIIPRKLMLREVKQPAPEYTIRGRARFPNPGLPDAGAQALPSLCLSHRAFCLSSVSFLGYLVVAASRLGHA